MTTPRASLWYAVHTHARAEFKAHEHLCRQNYQAYLPRYAKVVRHARRTHRVLRPMFPSYLFVTLDLTVQGWRSIRSTIGIADIVRFGDHPASLPPGFIESLTSQEDNEGNIHFALSNRLKCGDPVAILSGPFSRLVGVCEKMNEDERIAILLDLLGRKVRVRLDIEAVEAA